MQKRIGDFVRNDELQKHKFEVMEKVYRTIVYATIVMLFLPLSDWTFITTDLSVADFC